MTFSDLSLQGKLFRILTYILVGFMAYFVANLFVSRINKSYLWQVKTYSYPMLEKADSDLFTLGKLKSTITEAILTQDEEKVKAADEIAGSIKQSFTFLKDLDPKSKETLDKIEKSINDYYSDAKDLAERIATGISDISHSAGDIQRVNSKYAVANKTLSDFRETTYKRFLGNINRAIMTADAALGLGFLMFLVCIFAGIFAMNFVVRISKSLGHMGVQLQEAAEKLAMTSEMVHKSGALLSTNTREQSEAVAETVTTVDQIKATLEASVQESVVVLDSAQRTLSSASDGRNLVQSMLTEMSAIERANDQLNRITQVMELIVEKTNIINEIVFQSRILSFNANIEAARAGALGKGFAVVANEVAKLADMTGSASVEIRELLESSSKEVAGLVRNTNEKVRAGQASSLNCEKAFESISDNIADLTHKVDYIVKTSKDQVTAVKQISQAMGLIDKAAFKNDKSVSETVEVTVDLDKYSSELLESVALLNSLVKGKGEEDSLEVFHDKISGLAEKFNIWRERKAS